jgi:C1A family cysteine protease
MTDERTAGLISPVSGAPNRFGRGMGWLPDYPDFRDYDEARLEIRELIDAADGALKKSLEETILMPPPKDIKVLSERVRASDLPASVDLREYCSPVEDQGMLGSCTAHAGVGVIEYYERRAFGRHLDASRLFLYKATRNLMKLKGDTGAYLRTTIGAMVLFGVPPESYWPYTDNESSFDREPTAFCYAFAQNFQTIKYFRHDPSGASPADVLKRLKTYLAKGHPAMFGFSVYNSIEQAEKDGRIPFPSKRERVEGGHAVVAVGYDDKLEITNKFGGRTDQVRTKGALLIRNSWGKSWGEKGYGWLPYEYVTQGLADDFWSVLKKEWVDTGAFAE